MTRSRPRRPLPCGLELVSLALALACAPPASEPEAHAAADDPDDHADHAEAHIAHEHPEAPNTVELSADVIAAAQIRSTPIGERPLAPVIEAVGALEADPTRTFEIAAKVAGVVDAIEVRVGDRVAEGDPLVTIRAPGLGGLRADLAALRARQASAAANVDRLEILAAKQLASRQELTAARAEAAALAAEASAAKQRLRALGVGTRGSATAFALRSPTAGVVTARGVVEGEAVTEETTVLTITNLDEAWFMARVFEHALDRIEVGAQAEVVLNAFPNRPLVGVVDLLSPTVDPHARTVTARIVVQNPDGALRLGLFGRARIATRDAPSAPVLAVPRHALIEIDDRPVVFVDRGAGVYERHDVRLGAEAPGYVEVTEGLDAGERVVDSGAWSLKSVLLRGRIAEDHD